MFVVMMLLFAAAAVAQPEQRLVLTEPAPNRYRVVRNFQFGEGLHADLYQPRETGISAVLIFANATGADYSKWPGYISWAKYVAAGGVTAVLYQSTNTRPLSDFDTLIEALRAKAGALRIDPDRIAIWGSSANVKVALPVAMDAQRTYLCAAVIYYGAAPVDAIRADLPLLYVRSGLDDPSINESIDRLIARSLAANAPWVIENNAAGLHGFDIYNDTEISRRIILRTIAFIRDATTPEVAASYRAAAHDAALGGAFARGEWDAVIAGYSKKVQEQPEFGEAHRRLAVALHAKGQYERALVEYEAAYKYGRGGVRDTVVPAAIAAAALNDADRAVRWLEIAIATPFGPSIDDLRTNHAYASIRDSPRFQQLLTTTVGKPLPADAHRPPL